MVAPGALDLDRFADLGLEEVSHHGDRVGLLLDRDPHDRIMVITGGEEDRLDRTAVAGGFAWRRVFVHPGLMLD